MNERVDSAQTDSPTLAARMPKISIIMNGFNSRRYLREAISSVIVQTYDNWELIFWDNCSEDDSQQIVTSFMDPRIHFYCAPERMTLAAGRNAAIACAQSEWIAFLDCDDIWAPEKLEWQLARLALAGGRDIGLIYARTLSFSENGEEGETTYRYQGRPLPEGQIMRNLLLEGNLVPIVSALVSRKAYEHVGGIPNHLTFAEDYWLFVAIAANYRVLCVQETCCYYRVHQGSATYRNKLASHTEALEVFEQWGCDLPSKEMRARRAVYHTLIGIEMIRELGCIRGGLREILKHGSLPFLLRGAISHLLRRFVRRQRPYA